MRMALSDIMLGPELLNGSRALKNTPHMLVFLMECSCVKCPCSFWFVAVHYVDSTKLWGCDVEMYNRVYAIARYVCRWARNALVQLLNCFLGIPTIHVKTL